MRPGGILKNAQMSRIFYSCKLCLTLDIVHVFQRREIHLEQSTLLFSWNNFAHRLVVIVDSLLVVQLHTLL